MIKNKKAVFTFQKFLIGLVLFSLFVAVLGGTYYNMATTYGVSANKNYETYNKLEALSNQTTSIGEQYQGGKLAETNAFVLAAGSVYSGLQLMLNSISIPYELIKQASADFKFIPAVFITVLVIILGIIIVFGVGNALARWWS